jgi:hypothetical protein
MAFPGSWLGYGTVSVQTAGKDGTISFNYIPDIELVKRTIDIQKAHRQGYRPAASKLEIQQRLEGRFDLKLVLPERVRGASAKPKPVRKWWQSLLRPFANRRERRKARYQQDRIVWRKHWIVLVIELFWPVVLLIAALSFLLVQLFSQLLWLNPAAVAPLNFLLVFTSMVLLCVIAWRYVDWHNDTYEVTRNEVADVEKLPLFFDEKRRTARLLDIDNTRYEVPSTFHYLLNIGNVRLETAAVQGGFTFDTVFDPSGVVTEVRRRIEDARHREEQQRAEQRARELTDWFEIYNRLHHNRQP